MFVVFCVFDLSTTAHAKRQAPGKAMVDDRHEGRRNP